MARALVLFAHGARAASWAAPFERLQALSAARLPDCTVRLAFLELMEPRLAPCVAELVASGIDAITIVPVFLGQGGHLLRDLPLLVEGLRAAHSGLHLSVAGAVGEAPGVLAALTDYCVNAVAATPAD